MKEYNVNITVYDPWANPAIARKEYGIDIVNELEFSKPSVSIAMKIAQDHPGFDYDCYFRSRAELWREQMSLIRESGYITDAHPFNYQRVNAVNAQFDEFVQTYGLSEDNRMYIPPEERITIW